MPTEFEIHAPDPTDDAESEHHEVVAKTHKSIEELKKQFEAEQKSKTARETGNKAFLSALTAARKRIADARCFEQLQDTMRTLGEQSTWRGRLVGLERIARPPDDATTAGEGLRDRPHPVAILRYISQNEPEVRREANDLVGTARAGAELVLGVYASFRNAIGTLPRDAVTGNPYAWAGDPNINGRAANLAQVALFTVGAAGAVGTGLVALLTKENPNWTLPAMWLLFAGLAAGYGDITGSRNDRLGRQIGFLTRQNGGWEQLQTRYGLTGQPWAQLARTIMVDQPDHPALVQARNVRVTLTEAEQKSIVAMAPAGIQKQVAEMLASGGGRRGAHRDFRAFLGLLRRARTEEAQDLVTVFIQEGVTAGSLQALRPRTLAAAPPPTVPEEFPVIAPASGPSVLPAAPVPPTTTVTAPPRVIPPPPDLKKLEEDRAKKDAEDAKKRAEQTPRFAPAPPIAPRPGPSPAPAPGPAPAPETAERVYPTVADFVRAIPDGPVLAQLPRRFRIGASLFEVEGNALFLDNRRLTGQLSTLGSDWETIDLASMNRDRGRNIFSINRRNLQTKTVIDHLTQALPRLRRTETYSVEITGIVSVQLWTVAVPGRPAATPPASTPDATKAKIDKEATMTDAEKKAKDEEERKAEEKRKEEEARKKIEWPADHEARVKLITERFQPLIRGLPEGHNLLDSSPPADLDVIPGRLRLTIGGGIMRVNGRRVLLRFRLDAPSHPLGTFQTATLRDVRRTGDGLRYSLNSIGGYAPSEGTLDFSPSHNLAELILRISEGETVSPLHGLLSRVRFSLE